MKKPCNFSEESKRADHSSSPPCNGALLLSSSAPALLGHGGEFPSSSSSSFSADARAVAALRTHSLAEKRRRERINAHLATLRLMTANSSKKEANIKRIRAGKAMGGLISFFWQRLIWIRKYEANVGNLSADIITI